MYFPAVNVIVQFEFASAVSCVIAQPVAFAFSPVALFKLPVNVSVPTSPVAV